VEEWVLDTWVLARAHPDYDEMMNAVTVLCLVRDHHRIAIDHDGAIEAEYRPYIQCNDHVRKWWVHMTSTAGKICRRNGHLTTRHARYLVASKRIGQEDGVFVAVAANGYPTKHLVSGDGDYTGEVDSYLSSELGVTRFSVPDALRRLVT
jgi:hypothetical protein